MEINKKFFPEVLPDNEEVYFSHLIGVIESVDELCCLQITKMRNAYDFRIAPSAPDYIDIILKEILKFHNMFGIKLELSKSIKSSGGTIVFKISL